MTATYQKLPLQLLITTLLLLTVVSAAPRLTPKPDSDFNFIGPHLNRRVLEAYTPNKSNHTIVLRGDTTIGYYYATLFFGYPPQKETVIVDTGSSLTIVPCDPCARCGTTHLNKKFEPKDSENYQKMQCDAKMEAYVCKDCNSAVGCHFSIRYTEGSMYDGGMVADKITASDEMEEFFYGKPSELTPKDMLSEVQKQNLTGYFGCAVEEGGMFSTQAVDGIIGLGMKTNTQSGAPPNIVDLHAIHHKENYSNSFSLCFSSEGGYMTIGGRDDRYLDKNFKQISVHYTDSGQYTVGLHQLTMNGELVSGEQDFSQTNGNFVDSGTTMLYLSHTIYNNILSKLNTFCGKSSNNCGGGHKVDLNGDICYNRTISEWPSLNDFYASFPSLTFTMDSNQEHTLTGAEYLFPEVIGEEAYCLGFYPMGSRIILGGVFMRNYDFHFDKVHQTITIARANCSARAFPTGKDVAIDWKSTTPHPKPNTTTNDTPTNNNTHPNVSNETNKSSNTTTETTYNKQNLDQILFILVAIGGVLIVVGIVVIVLRKLRKRSNFAEEVEIGPQQTP